MSKITLIAFVSLIAFLGCNPDQDITKPNNNSENTSISFYFQKPSGLDNLVVFAEAIVTASDMDTIIFTLTVNDSSVFGTIENIPAGPERKFEIICYDNDYNITYSDYKYIDVFAGSTQLLEIILYPVTNTGIVIVYGTFASYPQSKERIVFQADYSGSYDIYIMNPNATNIQQLTNSKSDDYYPQLSPNRSKIVFCRHENNLTRPYIINADGTGLQHLDILPDKGVGYCGWSPDGNKLVIHAAYDGDCDIFVYDFGSKEVTQIVYNDATDWIPDWSPEGNKIVFYSNQTGIFKTYLVNPDGSNIQSLTNNTSAEEKVPRFSPDGTQIVMAARNIYAQWGIFKVSVDGSNFTEVTNTQGVDEGNPAWSPNGNKILFERFDGGPNKKGLFIINSDGSGLQMLLDTEYNEENPHWR